MEESKKYKNFLRGTDDLISPVDQKQVIVLDIGSSSIRIGISGDNQPFLDLPLVAGRSKNKDSNDLTQTKLPDAYGKKAIEIYKDKPQEYVLIYPLIDLEDQSKQVAELEPFLKYVFEDVLHIECTQVDLLVVSSLSLGEQFRINLMELCFETLRLQSINFVASSVASLFLSGRTTGCSLEFGHQSTNIVQIYEGFILKHALMTSNYGGNNATKIFHDYLIDELGINFEIMGKDKFQMIQKIKNKISALSFDYEEDIKESKEIDIEEKCFELPDRKIITINNETKFKSGEVLLRPNLLIENQSDIIERIQTSILKCELPLQKKLAQNILISGGVAQTLNLQERIQRDIDFSQDFDTHDLRFVIHKEQHLPNSSWIGGSLLGSISTYQQLKIKKTDYEESSDSRENFLFKKTIIQLNQIQSLQKFLQISLECFRMCKWRQFLMIAIQFFQEMMTLSLINKEKSVIVNVCFILVFIFYENFLRQSLQP